jgi:glycosyl hydrolase family 42 (putative beta-galactosidase)
MNRNSIPSVNARPLVLLISLIIPRYVPAQDSQSLRPWQDYRTIMWVGDSAAKKPEKLPLFYQRLHEMGINTAMVYGDGDPRPLIENKFPYYLENIVNTGLCLKFNSKVTDWDKFVTDWAKNGRPDSALVRDYCLDDPQWQNRARKQMQDVVRKNREHQPVACDIRDELSTTTSANPFDYDFNPICLQAFRQWLQTQYAGPGALNREWETSFASWDDVKPFTTDQIKNRMGSGKALPRGKPDWQQVQALKFDPLAAQKETTRWNFAPWADFRAYMDLSLARALDQLRRASHEIDPATPVGIEGTQMPAAFGGYDLWRLSQTLDWAEPYDIGNAREILGSFMPGKPLITTVFEGDTGRSRRRLWHLLLEGDRGCIVWWSEDCIDWKSEDYQLTSKAKALAPVLKELSSPLARLFLRAEREYDPIYLLYSQPSIQVDWLLESTVDGSTWLRRFSSYEADHNRMARTRDGWVKVFQDLGYTPRFISGEQLISGALPKTGAAALILPTAWALSEKEIGAIERFSVNGAAPRALFADGSPGLFDEHGRLRQSYPAELSKMFAVMSGDGTQVFVRPAANPNPQKSMASPGGQIGDYLSVRLKADSKLDWPGWISDKLKTMAPPQIGIPASACVRTHRYRIGNAHLVAFERNIDYHMSEDLKQAGGNERLEKPIEIDARLSTAAHVYDLRTEKYLGRLDKLHFPLDPWRPALFALTAEKLKTERVVQELSAFPW